MLAQVLADADAEPAWLPGLLEPAQDDGDVAAVNLL